MPLNVQAAQLFLKKRKKKKKKAVGIKRKDLKKFFFALLYQNGN